MFIKAHQSLLVRVPLILILIMGVLGTKPVQPVLAGTITVTNTNDSGAGSLRQVIASAVPGDTITFNSSLSGQTIALASTLVIDKNLIIDGSSLASKLSISGNNSVRVLEINSGTTVILNSLIIKNGYKSDQEGGGGLNFGTLTISHSTFSGNVARHGGGIINIGLLTITDSIFTDNHAIGSTPNSSSLGGGILNFGTLSIADSTFSNNATNLYGFGGGIHNKSTLNIYNSTFSGNNAGSGGALNNNSNGLTTIIGSSFFENSAEYGGAIVNFEKLDITNTTISANVGRSFGGGIDNGGTLTVENSTFANNISGGDGAAGQGGGIYNHYQSVVMTITNSTFSGNSAMEGGAIDNAGVMNFRNTILANSVQGNDCYNGGTIGVNTNNLVEGNSGGATFCGTPLFNNDPKLGPLTNNGGPTQTMALLVDSPAINTGDDSSCTDSDQRGVTRPQGAHCDIGAYEFDHIFTDVPTNYWSWSYIERLYAGGITGGCASRPLMYCPRSVVTRDQMAVFLLKGKHGSSYVPPAATGIFADVPQNYWAAAWIEQLAKEGITSGCNITPQASWYCPDTEVTRDQMAVFLLKAKHGSGYVPPAPTGVFVDVPQNYWAAAWIEQLAAEGITGGCGNNNYCPGSAVTRDQMAVFLVKNFNLP